MDLTPPKLAVDGGLDTSGRLVGGHGEGRAERAQQVANHGEPHVGVVAGEALGWGGAYDLYHLSIRRPAARVPSGWQRGVAPAAAGRSRPPVSCSCSSASSHPLPTPTRPYTGCTTRKFPPDEDGTLPRGGEAGPSP
jgi:hypothetical protein